MDRITFLVKQMFPLEYYTKYRSVDGLYVATWKQWLGRPYDVNHYKVCA